MATPMYSLYVAISNLVRMARSFLRRGEGDKAEKARDSIRSITESVGLTDLETQYPLEELLTTDLWSRLPQMNEAGPYRHVLRYGVDFASMGEVGSDDIYLELWRLDRRVHTMVATVGQLYTVRVKWGLQFIRLNIIALVDGVLQTGRIPAVMECGPNSIAYTCSRFDWEVFRAFSNQDNIAISASQRLLYMMVLDSKAFEHVDASMFTCWPRSMVQEEMDRHSAGQYFDRFTAEQSGLMDDVCLEEEEEGELDEAAGGSSSRGQMDQSPILQFISTMDLVKQYEEEEKIEELPWEKERREAISRDPRLMGRLYRRRFDQENRLAALLGPADAGSESEEEDEGDVEVPDRVERDEVDGAGSLEILRGPVADRTRSKIQPKNRKARDPLGRKKPQVRLTTAQFKAILALCIEGVEPRWSEDQVQKEVDKVDVEQLASQMDEKLLGLDDDEDVGEVLRRAIVEQGNDEQDDEVGEMVPWSPREVRPISDEEVFPHYELEEDSEERLSASLDIDEIDQVLDETSVTDGELEEMPELLSPESWGKPEEWDTTWHSSSSCQDGTDSGSSGRRSSKGQSPGNTPPPLKKVKRDLMERSGSSPVKQGSGASPAYFSPFLSKQVSNEHIYTVSTSSSDGEARRKDKVRKKITFPDGEVRWIEANIPIGAVFIDDVVVTNDQEVGETEETNVDKEEARDDTGETDQ